jgi:hypothetical protein
LVPVGCHRDFAIKASNGGSNPFIVGRHQNPFDGCGPLDAPVDVFDQRLTLNFNHGLSGETGGAKSGRDDCYGTLEFHAGYRRK